MMGKQTLFIFFLHYIIPTIGMEYCDGNYLCEHGHCCGNGKCCTYYYEVWWFWVIWSAIALITGCCFYQQKRLRMRRQRLYNIQQTLSAQVAAADAPSRRTRRSLRSQSGQAMLAAALPPVHPVVFGPPMPPGSEKNFYLPTYDEIDNLPKDPPAYDTVYNSDTLRAGRLPVVDPAAFGLHDPGWNGTQPLAAPGYSAVAPPHMSSIAIQVDTPRCTRGVGGSPTEPAAAAVAFTSPSDALLPREPCGSPSEGASVQVGAESMFHRVAGSQEDAIASASAIDTADGSAPQDPSRAQQYTSSSAIDDRPDAHLLDNEEAMDENHFRSSSA